MIEVEDLYVSYGKKEVIKCLSFKAEGVMVVAGPNGAGKSTLLRAVAGGLKAKGFIKIFDKVVLSEEVFVPPEERDVAYLPQGGGPLPFLTVEENLRLAGGAREDVIDAFGIRGLLKLKGKELSGGQKKKVGIAMVVSSGKRAWLLDEPLAGIDPHSRKWIAEKIVEFAKERGATVLWTSHLKEAFDVADSVLRMGDEVVL